jgi:hypothetical protein
LEELLNRADAELGGGVRAGGGASANPPAGNIIRLKSITILRGKTIRDDDRTVIDCCNFLRSPLKIGQTNINS